MSTRTNLRPQQVISAGDMSDDIVSDPTILQSLSKLSYAMSWTGTSPVGTVSVEGSNDYSLDCNGNVLNAGTWSVLTLQVNGLPTTTVTITGNTGSGIIDITDTAIYALRLIYTAGSGVGSLTTYVTGKVA